MPETDALFVDALEQVLDHLLFVRAARRVDPVVAVLKLIAFVNEQRHVTAVIDDEFGTLVCRRT